MFRRTHHLIAVVAVALGAAVAVAPAPVGAKATAPTLSGPVTGGNGLPVLYGHTTFDLGSEGYTRSEHFLSGTASAYESAGPLTADGAWTVSPVAEAPYVTRVVVNRPQRTRDFNGTVVVEWFNVSGGVDASPDWNQMHVELMRRGYAWVGVSAQTVGVASLQGTERGDPARYASLSHPGDSYSYDIFSQAGRAVRDHADALLGGLEPEHVLGVGESQSAVRLTTYINAAHPLARAYDGFLVHSRFAGAAPLTQAPLPNVSPPSPVAIRSDLDVPVLVFQTENDGMARQVDTARFRLWEVAGTAHYDQYGLKQGATDTGGRESVQAWFDSMRSPTNQPSERFTCESPINTGPQTFVLRAAIAGLRRWVAEGTAPSKAPRLETVSPQSAEYAVDEVGNVLGGIRTPAIDAPVARLSGRGQSGQQWCFLFGTTVPLTDEQLVAKYGDRRGFLSTWNRSLRQAVDLGFVVRDDAVHLRAVAAQANMNMMESSPG